ncbi:Kelch-like protein 8 [Trichinella pseudospiralis]|uniref:Kelch-like protein 8 n=2 Tax=Trichinella pseudospiralis TaxID=6337 RepID=A0A0V1G3V0_TRIPS|nr:Kelch-like protein 8 [Trichinella pseudospiralis]
MVMTYFIVKKFELQSFMMESETSQFVVQNSFSNESDELWDTFEISSQNFPARVDTVSEKHFSDSFELLNEFKLSGFLCDITIKVEGGEFRCHKSVLASTIPYFRSMFASEMKESHQEEVEIRGVSADSFKHILDFVYTGKVTLTMENVQCLLYTSSFFQVDSVFHSCEAFLAQRLSPYNCLWIRKISLMYDCQYLLKCVDEYTLEHFKEVCLAPDFLEITVDHLDQLISDSNLNVSSESDVFAVVMKWVVFDMDARYRFLVDLLTRIRFQHLPPSFLLRCIDGNLLKRICSDMQVHEKLIHTLMTVLYQDTSVLNAANLLSIKPTLPRKSTVGVIFCVGGRGSNGCPFRSVEVYDWRRDRWFSVLKMVYQRRHVGVVSANGKVYAIGGHSGIDHLSSVEVFDPLLGLWTSRASMNTNRRGIATAHLEGAIYAVGGLDDSACFSKVERYDIELDSWSFVSRMNVPRGGVGVTSLGGYLFAIGGNNGTSALDSCERYSPYLNRWTNIASMVQRRAGAGVAALNGMIYAVGGFDDNSPLSSVERYDPTLNIWTMVPPMSCPRGGVGVAAMGGRLYAVGGHDGANYLNTVEAFDPIENRWTPVASTSHCRAGAGVAWCDCSVEMLTSNSVANCLKTV